MLKAHIALTQQFFLYISQKVCSLAITSVLKTPTQKTLPDFTFCILQVNFSTVSFFTSFLFLLSIYFLKFVLREIQLFTYILNGLQDGCNILLFFQFIIVKMRLTKFLYAIYNYFFNPYYEGVSKGMDPQSEAIIFF